MGEWRIDWREPEAGQHFGASMEARRQSELQEEFKPIRRGWCIGSDGFRAQMLEYVERQRGKWHYGAELWESAQAKAEQLIAQALAAEKLSEQDLVNWPKGHPFKIALASRLRTGNDGHDRLAGPAPENRNTWLPRAPAQTPTRT